MYIETGKIIKVKAIRQSIYSHHGQNPAERETEKKLEIREVLSNGRFSVRIIGMKITVGSNRKMDRVGILDMIDDESGILRSGHGRPVKFQVTIIDEDKSMRYYAEIRVGDIDEHYINQIVEGRTAQSAFNKAVAVAKKAHDLQDEKHVIIDVFDREDDRGSIIHELVTLRK